MLSLKVNDQVLDLPDNFAITFNKKSPAFHDIGSYSYPFRIQNTLRNASILGFKHRIENATDPYLTFQVTLLWKNNVISSGIMKCQLAGRDYYEGTIYPDSGDFYYDLKNRFLNQFDYGKIEFDTEDDAIDYFNECVDYYHPARKICFPEIFNDVYFEPPTTNSGLTYFNTYFLRQGTWDWKLLLLTPERLERTLLMPHLFFKYVIKVLFEGLGYKLVDQVFNHADYNRLVVFNALSCNDLLEKIDYLVTSIQFNAHLPNLLIADFIKSVEMLWNVRFFIDNSRRVVKLVSMNDVMRAGETTDFSKNILGITLDLEEKINGYHMMMELDPDDEKFDDIKTDEDQILSFFRGAVQSLGNLPLWPIADFGEVRWVIDEESYYALNILKEWIALPISEITMNTQFLLGDGDISIVSNLSTLSSKGNNLQCGNKYENWKDIALRVFFVERYEISERVKTIGSQESDNFSLWFNGDKGLFKKYYEDYLYWRTTTKMVSIEKQMDFVELAELDFSRKYRINDINYLISEIQVTLMKNRIKPAKLICYTCP